MIQISSVGNLSIQYNIMQICYMPASNTESEARVWAADRGAGERKTGNGKF